MLEGPVNANALLFALFPFFSFLFFFRRERNVLRGVKGRGRWGKGIVQAE